MHISHLTLFAALTIFAAQLKAQTYAISRFSVNETFKATSIAADAEGSIVFADGYATVGRVSPSGVVTILAGAINQLGSVDGVGASARFSRPTGVALDSAGNIYVADAGNGTVRKIARGGIVTTLAGQTRASETVDGIAQAGFRSLGAIAVGATDDVFVGDHDGSGNLIRRISPTGVVTTIARSPKEGAVGPVAPFSVAGLVADSLGNLYFADPLGCTVRKASPAGNVTVLAGAYNQRGSADGASSAAAFYNPNAIAWDANGNLLVIDGDQRTVRRITLDGVVTTVAGQPYPNYSPGIIEGVGGAAWLRSAAMTSDRAGNIYLLSTDQWLSPNAYGSLLMKGTPTMEPSIPILTVSPSRDTPFANINTRDVGARSAVTFTAAAASDIPVSFQWLRDGNPVAGATRATIEIGSAAASDEGDYKIRVSNAAGAFTSDRVTLRVFSPAFDTFTARRAAAGGSFLWGIASGAGKLVTVGTGGKILTSIDGRAWTARDSGTTEWLVGVTYGAGKFIAVGDHGVILVSGDGITWSRAPTTDTTQRLNNVAFGDNRFVAVGEGGAIVTSADARIWTAQSSGVSTWLRGLTYDGGFYASGRGGVILEQSASGSWSRVNGPTLFVPFNPTRDIEALAVGPTGIGQDGWAIQRELWLSGTPNSLTTRSPGNSGTYYLPNWSSRYVGLTGRFRGLARGAGAIFATGENGVIAAAQSFYGPWSFIPTGTSSNLVSGVFHGNSMFVVGENETILQSQPLFQSKLANIATRGLVAPGNPMIAGFVIAGDTVKQVLVRAAGPALAKFGIAATVAAPILKITDSSGREVTANAGWSTSSNSAEIAQVTGRVGAFPFVPGSLDSALFVTLLPGTYTAQVNGDSGTTLVEVYDADSAPNQGSRTINIATRAQVGAGEARLIAGFVISGAASRQVLIRAIGPSLAQFGLTGALGEPQIELYDQSGRLLQRAGAWRDQTNAGEIQTSAVIAGAFSLDENSKDAALITSLLPGSYTVQVSGLDRTATGLALVEVYDLP